MSTVAVTFHRHHFSILNANDHVLSRARPAELFLVFLGEHSWFSVFEVSWKKL